MKIAGLIFAHDWRVTNRNNEYSRPNLCAWLRSTNNRVPPKKHCFRCTVENTKKYQREKHFKDRIPDANLHGSIEFKTHIRHMTARLWRGIPINFDTRTCVWTQSWHGKMFKSVAGTASRQLSREKMKDTRSRTTNRVDVNPWSN